MDDFFDLDNYVALFVRLSESNKAKSLRYTNKKHVSSILSQLVKITSRVKAAILDMDTSYFESMQSELNDREDVFTSDDFYTPYRFYNAILDTLNVVSDMKHGALENEDHVLWVEVITNLSDCLDHLLDLL